MNTGKTAPMGAVSWTHICAFKDVALQLLGNLLEHFLVRRNKDKTSVERHHLTVSGATRLDLPSHMNCVGRKMCRSSFCIQKEDSVCARSTNDNRS